jgi:hypothetical protein
MQSIQNIALFIIIISISSSSSSINITIIISPFAVTELRFYEFLLLSIAFIKFYKHDLHHGANFKCVKLLDCVRYPRNQKWCK